MQSLILVVALNPSIDVEWEVNDVRWEEKNSIRSERRWPGGKGVNVARWLRHLSAAPRLLLPLGGRNGEELAQGAKSERLKFKSIRVREETRANIIVTTKRSRQMRFNPLGPAVSSGEWRALLNQFMRQLPQAALVVLSGSLPRGVGSSAYAELIALSNKAGVRCLLDCDGEAFEAGIKAKPFLVKPNLHELEQWVGHPLKGRRAIAKAAVALSNLTGNWALVSLGAHGGLLVNAAGECYDARSPRCKAVNTVGAGDAMLAGVAKAIATGLLPSQWLQLGLACGSSMVSYPAGVLVPLMSIKQLRKKIQPKTVLCLPRK
jgi:1-phosphofructokinase family hexose kinase